MNIMIITAMFPPIRTGSSFYAQDMADGLRRRGHNVIVTTLSNKEADDDYGFPVFRLPAIHVESFFKKFFKHFRVSSFFFGNYLRVNRLIEKHDIDVIFLVSHYHDIAFPAVAASLYSKKPLVCSINTQLQMLNPVKGGVLKFFDRLICGKLILPFCTKIVSLDTEIERYLSDVYKKKIIDKSEIIPYGFHGDMGLFLEHDHDYRLHNQLIGIGAVIQQRNFLSSITIFSKLLKIYPNLKFKIIGHVYHDAAVKLVKRLGIEDKVLFTGELPHSSILEEIKKSDIYMGIFSGKYVGLGTATIESMLMGLPILSNAPPDLFGATRLHDMGNYVYAKSEKMDEAVAKASRLLEEKELRIKIGQGGRAFVREHLNWDVIAEKVEGLFASLDRPSMGI